MGIGYVMWICDDAIRGAKVPSPEKDKICSDLAEGVLEVCLDPNYESTPDGLRRYPAATVANHGNGINFVDEIHSRDWGVYLWGENCLRKISDLDEFGFEKLKELVSKEDERRSNSMP